MVMNSLTSASTFAIAFLVYVVLLFSFLSIHKTTSYRQPYLIICPPLRMIPMFLGVSPMFFVLLPSFPCSRFVLFSPLSVLFSLFLSAISLFCLLYSMSPLCAVFEFLSGTYRCSLMLSFLNAILLSSFSMPSPFFPLFPSSLCLLSLLIVPSFSPSSPLPLVSYLDVILPLLWHPVYVAVY